MDSQDALPGAVFISLTAWKAPLKRRLFFLALAPGFPALSFFPGCLPRWPRAHGKGICSGRCSGYRAGQHHPGPGESHLKEG